MIHHPTRTRGLATVSAIMLMAVVGAAVTTMSWHFHADVTRTKALRAEAQLQQLLHGASAHALHLASVTPDPQTLELSSIEMPSIHSIHHASAHFTIHRQGDELTIEIHARFQTLARRQTLKLTRQNDQWSLASLTMHDRQ